MANDILETGLGALAFSRKVTLGLLEDIPEDKLTHQPTPGANHAIWIMGHIALTDQFFLSNVGQRPVTNLDAWKDLFFMGSRPRADLSDYPPPAEIRCCLEASREELIAWFKSLDRVQLTTPLPKGFEGFGPLHANLMTSTAVHEGLHAGQLTVVRKGLGIAPVFG